MSWTFPLEHVSCVALFANIRSEVGSVPALLLRVCSCIGSEFSVETLAAVVPLQINAELLAKELTVLQRTMHMVHLPGLTTHTLQRVVFFCAMQQMQMVIPCRLPLPRRSFRRYGAPLQMQTLTILCVHRQHTIHLRLRRVR